MKYRLSLTYIGAGGAI